MSARLTWPSARLGVLAGLVLSTLAVPPSEATPAPPSAAWAPADAGTWDSAPEPATEPRPSRTVAPEQHGRLLAAVRARISLPGGTRARAWQLRYTSTTATGAPSVATGALIVPEHSATDPRPTIALGVGSQGLADGCAPSRNLASGALIETVLIAPLVRRGWSVVVPDGEGLGSPGRATYAVGRSAGRAMLDVVRAAHDVGAAGVHRSAPVGLFGYSVGGSAAAWAAELHPSYAPELHLVGAAAGGAVVDLPAFVRRGLSSGATVTAFSALLGLRAAYPELDLDRYLTARGHAAAGITASHCIYPAIALTALLGGRGAASFVRSDPFAQAGWAARAAQEQPGQAPPSARVLLFHGTADQAVPIAGPRALRTAWREQGARVDWLPVPAEHVGAMVAGQLIAADWLSARFRESLPRPGR